MVVDKSRPKCVNDKNMKYVLSCVPVPSSVSDQKWVFDFFVVTFWRCYDGGVCGFGL